MTEPGYLRYYDQRYGDTYEIYLDAEGGFLSAARSVDKIGNRPIFYDSMEDIPAYHRSVIEGLIEGYNKTHGK